MCSKQIINLIGLSLNFLGAILLALSFVAGEDQGDTENDKGKIRKIYLPSFYKTRFYFGVTFLVFGFLFQIISAIGIGS